MAPTCPAKVRERRSMTRSRFGCRNCKLRKVKCDESKPCCKRCISFGVLCNFRLDVLDLQPVTCDPVLYASQVARQGTVLQAPPSSSVWTSDGSNFYQLDSKCQDFVTRYLGRSLITPDDPKMVQVNRSLMALAFFNPFLMHASIAVAYAYDRHLTQSSDCRLSVEECYHRSQSLAIFNKRLNEPINIKDKDAIWATAAALAVLSFSTPDATTPEESWPLKPAQPTDLEWLRINTGKMSLWCLANPLRSDSLFRIMESTFAEMNSPLPEKGIDGMLIVLACVCHLEDSSTTENNPYFKAAHAVSRIQRLPDNQVTIGQTEVFTRCICGPFKSLLQRKDPIALLLMYLWYRKAGRSIWWIELRARVECPSISSYLRLYHSRYATVHAFLPGGVLETWIEG
ncbi:hypothetical protein CI102_5521 [Trichoderma harzianum]|uniref:Zn(2)-C6 fungal-type domain-containing protein n=1 Tax=Trichoderma harzianum CBS 226.95 TaxID=983964 RepID=A0A2T3ZVC7_TRIHA|nr:hypothetical protein M431DRAFT_99330 [Trichoderma harzianum CBS 226.95]PKK48018.1 hypothetical protein CI102_5521 [Trichoderma harzianum]PTB48766.1 hypothetical protein M431DRAFT_99330 [Trichoderma harzianum CBS 226.95]